MLRQRAAPLRSRVAEMMKLLEPAGFVPNGPQLIVLRPSVRTIAFPGVGWEQMCPKSFPY